MQPKPKTSHRVLVADDDPSIRQLLTTIIKREKLEVDAVSDGAEAVEKLKERPYTVILLDLMMPRLDGFGVIDYLLDHPLPVKPVVLVITAYADQKFKEVDSDVVSGVIRKPFEVSEVGSLVRLCIHGFDELVQKELMTSRDRSIRDYVEQQWNGPRNPNTPDN
jgi:CheY-like chemotaxis protein